ncbi:MAG TPA: DUF488 domain-containing protein [Thermoleophilaceae bacterium]|nr:DUF488 domain-containing protein [Thermoleophilaceae bacterium]
MRGRLTTVGVYGFSAESFLDALRAAGVGRVIDVRQRRGVRGTEYAWANSKRLQAALAEAKVEYEHRPELAPTTELRRLQYAEDARRGEGKRSRSELAAEYVRRYTDEILERVGVEELARSLQAGPLAALLCVERDPEACHRSLIAARLAEEHGFEVEDLRP